MTEIIEEESSYVKGDKFEKLFADFLRSQPEWDNAKTRVQLKGKENSKGANVDVVGIKTDNRYGYFNRVGWIVWGVGTALLIIGFVLMWLEIEIDIAWLSLSFGLSSAAVGAFVLIFYKERFCDKHAWVECKDLKGKATYAQVQKCLHEYNDYKKTGDKKFHFIKKIFVSTNGFMENAHAFALENGFECYVVKDGKFKIHQYWE